MIEPNPEGQNKSLDPPKMVASERFKSTLKRPRNPEYQLKNFEEDVEELKKTYLNECPPLNDKLREHEQHLYETILLTENSDAYEKEKMQLETKVDNHGRLQTAFDLLHKSVTVPEIPGKKPLSSLAVSPEEKIDLLNRYFNGTLPKDDSVQLETRAITDLSELEIRYNAPIPKESLCIKNEIRGMLYPAFDYTRHPLNRIAPYEPWLWFGVVSFGFALLLRFIQQNEKK